MPILLHTCHPQDQERIFPGRSARCSVALSPPLRWLHRINASLGRQGLEDRQKGTQHEPQCMGLLKPRTCFTTVLPHINNSQPTQTSLFVYIFLERVLFYIRNHSLFYCQVNVLLG